MRIRIWLRSDFQCEGVDFARTLSGILVQMKYCRQCGIFRSVYNENCVGLRKFMALLLPVLFDDRVPNLALSEFVVVQFLSSPSLWILFIACT